MPDEPMTNEPLPLPPSEPGVGLTQRPDEASAEQPRRTFSGRAGTEDAREEWVGPKTQKAIDAM